MTVSDTTQRRQDRDDVGDAQRREQPAFHAAQREQRHEHQHDQDRAEDDRVADLAAGLVDDAQRRLGIRRVLVLAQPAEDVLDVDDRVVDQFADRHGQAAERHRVDRHAEPLEDQPRDDDRQRNRRERDERRAEVQQEQEQDDDDQDAAVAQRLDDVVNAQVDERLSADRPRG